MVMRILAIFSVLLCTFMLTQASTVHAQQLDSFLTPNISISVQPEYPRPGEVITAELNDYGSSVYGATITWFINNQELTEFANYRTVTLTAGAIGTNDTLSAVLSTNSHREVVETVITPVYLDIVIEPQTRVPDFYMGRALPSLGSIINATALINGRANPDYIYTWRVEQTVLENGPIRGRNQVSFSTPMGSALSLSLQVSKPTGEIVARRVLSVPSVAPEIHFYELSTLFGLSHRAITDRYNLTSQSATIQAEPFYLDSRVYNNPAIKEWSINRRATPNSSANPYQITIERSGSLGVNSLEFHVRDLKQVLQGAKASTDINF